MTAPWKHPRTGVYWLRKAVPVPLKGPLADLMGKPGKLHHELIRSLKTKDIPEAKRRMPAALAWADGWLAAARDGARPLTNTEIHALAGLWYRRLLDEWDRDEAAFRRWEGWREIVDTEDLRLQPSEVADFLALEGVVTGPESQETLGRLMASGLWQALVRQDQVQAGDFRPDPRIEGFPAWVPPVATPAPSAPLAPMVSLTGLFGNWEVIATAKPRSIAEARYAMGRLVAFLGHDDASRLTKRDLQGWRNEMKADGKSNTTWNNQLSHVRQPIAFAVREGLLPADVTSDLRLRKQRGADRLPYDDDDAVAILQAARAEPRPSIRWGHWLMAFTGMRVGETLQLRCSDVQKEGDIWFLSVNEDDPSASVKNGKRRNVPLHPALIDEGFLAYVETVPTDGPLFPDKRLDAFGQRGGRGWNVMAPLVRQTVGITDPLKAPNHAWRHRMEDALRKVQVDEEDRDAIIGHCRKTMGRTYGVRGVELQRLAAALALVPVPPGLPMPSVS